ncbi:MAG: 5'/3'-nucleotidase SurE [Acidobacteriota bacterium]
MTTDKRILITNDDGVFSEGLKLLAEALAEVGRVTVVAPDREQSASGHALTLHRPLRIRQLEETWFSVDGTPTDCVNLAVLWLMKDDPPDLVCSGINFGTNLGDDVTYSGTVSATFEGTLLGVPSLAFSQAIGEHFSFKPGAAVARDLVAQLLTDELAHELPEDLCLNVNFPVGEIQGVTFTRLGRRRYNQSIVEKLDPRGRKYYWIAGAPEWEQGEGTDYVALSKGLVSVTPLHLDLTDYRGLETYGPLRERLERVPAELSPVPDPGPDGAHRGDDG